MHLLRYSSNVFMSDSNHLYFRKLLNMKNKTNEFSYWMGEHTYNYYLWRRYGWQHVNCGRNLHIHPILVLRQEQLIPLTSRAFVHFGMVLIDEVLDIPGYSADSLLNFHQVVAYRMGRTRKKECILYSSLPLSPTPALVKSQGSSSYLAPSRKSSALSFVPLLWLAW